MEQKDSPPTPAAKSPRGATLKQQLFAAAYIDPHGANGNGVAAARAAGYRGNAKQLAVQACNNLKNESVQGQIATMLDGMVEPALQSLSEAITATKVRAFLTKNGDIVYAQAEPDQKTRLTAIRFVFELRRTSNQVSPPADYKGELADLITKDPAPVATAVQEMSPADRMAFREAGDIEQELAEVERKMAQEAEENDEAHE